MAIYQADTGVSYDDTFNSLDWVFNNKVKIYGKMTEQEIYEYFDLFRTYLNNTINNILLVNKTDEKEEYIRKLCRYVIKNLLPICNKKIAYYSSKKNPKNNNGYMLSNSEMVMFNNWLDMEDDLFAIASMRSLTHYALYLERDDSLDQKVWCYILNDVMGGIFYYANQMILNKKYQNLFKQCPTGYGKCVSKDTLVYTENGIKEIKDINVGDLVYSMNNNKLVLQKVLNKWESKKPQYKITTKSGKKIIVSPEHRLFTKNGYVQAKDMTTNDYLYSIIDQKYEFIYSTLEENGYLKKYNDRRLIKLDFNSEKLADDFQSLLNSCGIFSQKFSSNNKWYVKIPREYNNILFNNYVCYKTHLLDEVECDNFCWDKIQSIEYDSQEIDMVDIEVENDHNFVANGIVSHNSKSDCNIICYILGYDPNASIMKVVGNPRLVGEMTENVVKMLQSNRHKKVFKQFAINDDKNKNDDALFSTISKKDGVFKLSFSKKARTFLCVNKDTDIDGTRYDYQFFDDITQSKDRENVNKHMADREKFTGQWRKRASSEYEVRRFFTGTAYHVEDFLSYCKSYYANQQPLIADVDIINFKWRKFCRLSRDKKSVYIMVPKLADLDLGEEKCYCTFPQKYTKYEALNMLHGSLGSTREFWAMEQQQPLPPETLAFDYAYLQTYSILPKDILEKDCLTKIIIDPSRKGKDNFAGLIFKKSSLENQDKYYFTSCYYKKTSGKVALPEIADLIVEHKVDVIYIENNIDCVQLLEQELAKRNYYSYKILDFYSYMKKDEKIAKYRDDIRDKIIFPVQRMYHFDSDMGRALKDITNYRLDGNNENDDSIDCCAMFCEQETEHMENAVEVFDFDFSLR